MSASPLVLVGAPGSPYSRKMRSLLRYRRIEHRWVLRGSRHDRGIPDVPVALIPVVVFPDEPDRAMIDSTFQIRRLEEKRADRRVLPPDPALAFLDFLVEDFADEWLTKAMFHYRWSFPEDVANAAAILPRWRLTDAPDERIAELSKVFAERQIGRLPVVGIDETTAPVIEESYVGLLRALDAHLARQPFVMGDRPGSADFGLFGQLTQLALFDPTAVSVTRRESPRVMAWCDVVEDLSGIEVDDGGWMSRDDVGGSFRGLLEVAGAYYAPFLLANAAALSAGAERVECEIAARRWRQKPFPYQGKCLGWLREARAALSDADRAFVDSALADTGCETLFAD